MKGLELAEKFYLECGAPMLREQFSEWEGVIAVGLAGSGSECFGYDDELSRDHDFEPGFCLFLPSEDVINRKTAFALERAYAKLPMEFMGFHRSPLNPVGGSRHGVIRMADFFKQKTGRADGDLAIADWFSVPEQALAEATGGKVFRDDLGAFGAIRERISYFPSDVRLKKLAGYLLLMGQAGQYNYGRCLARGETAAAQLAVGEFVSSTLHVIFLLNRRYLPYYKWSFRALRELPILSDLAKPLEYLLSSGNDDGEAKRKLETVELVSAAVVEELRRQELTHFAGSALEGHAYAVNGEIIDAEIRNLHILHAV